MAIYSHRALSIAVLILSRQYARCFCIDNLDYGFKEFYWVLEILMVDGDGQNVSSLETWSFKSKTDGPNWLSSRYIPCDGDVVGDSLSLSLSLSLPPLSIYKPNSTLSPNTSLNSLGVYTWGSISLRHWMHSVYNPIYQVMFEHYCNNNEFCIKELNWPKVHQPF